MKDVYLELKWDGRDYCHCVITYDGFPIPKTVVSIHQKRSEEP
jgi:hypothetical protein